MHTKSLSQLLPAIALFLATFAFAASCSEDADCSMTARGMMGCTPFRYDEATDTIVRDTLPLLTVKALVADSVLINRQEKVKEFSLPLRYAADSTALQLLYDEEVADTLVVWHENTPYFLSMECGYQMKQHITRVSHTRHLLDSIHISKTEVGIYGTENLKLYY